MKSITLIVIALLIASPIPISAQTPTESLPPVDWADVLALKPGTELVVAVRGDRSDRRHRYLVLAEETRLGVEARDGFVRTIERIPRDSVVQISRRDKVKKASLALLVFSAIGGLAGGGALGGFLGYQLTPPRRGVFDFASLENAGTGIMVGAPIGALVGGLLAHRLGKHSTEHVIYHAK